MLFPLVWVGDYKSSGLVDILGTRGGRKGAPTEAVVVEGNPEQPGGSSRSAPPDAMWRLTGHSGQRAHSASVGDEAYQKATPGDTVLAVFCAREMLYASSVGPRTFGTALTLELRGAVGLLSTPSGRVYVESGP